MWNLENKTKKYGRYDAMQTRYALDILDKFSSVHIMAWCGTSDGGRPRRPSDNLCCSTWCDGNGDIWQTAAGTLPISRTCTMRIAECHLWTRPCDRDFS